MASFPLAEISLTGNTAVTLLLMLTASVPPAEISLTGNTSQIPMLNRFPQHYPQKKSPQATL